LKKIKNYKFFQKLKRKNRWLKKFKERRWKKLKERREMTLKKENK
jgi:hypothetical protein